jgi:hypothetical protein
VQKNPQRISEDTTPVFVRSPPCGQPNLPILVRGLILQVAQQIVTASVCYLTERNLHNLIQIHVGEQMMNEVEILISPEISEVLRRIDSLKLAENISLEEKVRIAQLILSVIEEETDGTMMVQ